MNKNKALCIFHVRRELLLALGAASVFAYPLYAHAQHRALPVIGFVSATSKPMASALEPFRKGLSELGFVEGRNVVIEFRGTDQYDQLPALAAELVQRKVDVIFTHTNTNAAMAAKAATATIPIVFATGIDPVHLGLVASLNKPGDNVTGVSYLTNELTPKRLEMLRELAPRSALIAYLVNPKNLFGKSDTAEVLAAAQRVGQKIIVLHASSAAEIDAAYASLARTRPGGLLVNPDSFFNSQSAQLLELSARHRIPTIYYLRDFALAGGLISYGDDRFESLRQAAIYVGRILKGAKPENLPVLQPTQFDLVVNLKTARALGITIPPSVMVRATRVIE